jgi:hypothetical protein
MMLMQQDVSFPSNDINQQTDAAAFVPCQALLLTLFMSHTASSVCRNTPGSTLGNGAKPAVLQRIDGCGPQDIAHMQLVVVSCLSLTCNTNEEPAAAAAAAAARVSAGVPSTLAPQLAPGS